MHFRLAHHRLTVNLKSEQETETSRLPAKELAIFHAALMKFDFSSNTLLTPKLQVIRKSEEVCELVKDIDELTKSGKAAIK